MKNPDPALLSSAELAARLGLSRSGLYKWRRERTPEGQRLRACIHRATKRSTYWNVARLRKAGLLPDATPAPEIVADATTSFTASMAWGRVL